MKLYAYWITVNYRESYGMYACNGLLFIQRVRVGQMFVTRKITRGLPVRWIGSMYYISNLDSNVPAITRTSKCSG